MRQPYAGALAALRDFNYERIYTRPGSIAQGETVVAVLRDLVEYYASNPTTIPSGLRPAAGSTDETPGSGADSDLRRAITYVSGMTDRFAFSAAVRLLGWPLDRLPRGIDAPAPSL